MYITKIILKNFKRHKELEKDFRPGTNAICGPNGAGKSSIVEAIGYALFNNTPSLGGRRTAELVRKGAKEATIIVEFEANLDKRLYRVRRKISTKGSSSFAVYDVEQNKLLVQGVKDSLNLLRELMELDERIELTPLFNSILGVPQGTLTAAFLQPEQQRRKIFSPLLRVDEYKTAQEKSKILDQSVKNRHARLDSKIERLKDKLDELPEKETLLSELKKEVDALIEEKNTYEKRLPLLEKILAEMEQLKKELEKKENQHKRKQGDLEALQHRIEQANNYFEEAKQAQQQIAEVQKDVAQYHELLKTNEELQREEKRKQTLQKQLNKLLLELGKLKHQLERLEEKKTELTTYQTQWQELQPKIERQKQLENEQKNLNEQFVRRKQLEGQWKAQKEQLDKLDEEIQRAQMELRDYAAFAHAKEQQEAITEQGHQLREKEDFLKNQQKRREELLEDFQKQEALIIKLSRDLEERKKQREAFFQQRIQDASSFEKLNQHLQQLEDQLRKLTLQIEHEENLAKNVSGSLCPFLKEPCQNLTPGQSLENYVQNDLQNLRQQHEQLQRELTQTKQQWQRAQRAKQELEMEGQKLDAQIQVQEDNLRQERENLENKRQRYQAIPDVKKDLNNISYELQELRQQYAELTPKVQRAQQLEHLKVSMENNKIRFQTMQKEQEEILQELKRLQDVEPSLQKVQEELHTLNNPQREAQDLTQKIEKLSSVHEDWKNLNEQYQQKHEQQRQLEEEIHTLAHVEDELKKNEKKLLALQESYQIYLANHQIAQHYQQRLEELNRLKREQTSLTQTIEKLTQEIASLNEKIDEEAFLKNQEEYRELWEQKTRNEAILPEKKKQLERIQLEVTKLKKEEFELQEARDEIQKLEELADCTTMIRNVFKKAEPEITKALISSISREAREIFHHLMERRDLILTWTEKYEILINENGQDRSFGNLSGGEQMSAALAVRLAFVKELSQVRIAFFDEPTAHMDSFRRHNLAQQLTTITGFDQLFVISHDDTFEAMTEHVVCVGRET